MVKFYGKAEETVNALVAAFERGDVPAAVARTVLTEGDNKGVAGRPMDAWSWNNRFLAVLMLGTDDARGYQQWRAVGRQVRKVETAAHILIPCTGKREVETDGGKEERSFLYGFKSCPVFGLEQTEVADAAKWEAAGSKAPDYKPAEPPPLWEVAEAWGIKVSYAPFRGRYYGWCAVDGRQIGLNTHDTLTWLHELGHAAETRTRGANKGGQKWDQEVVAETVGAVLCEMLGQGQVKGQAYGYVRDYAAAAGMTAGQACLKVLGRIRAAVEAIVEAAGQQRQETPALAAD